MIAGTIGFSGGNTFYDSLLTELVPYDQRDDISAKGYMFGYIGGGILLVINLVMIEMPELLFMPDALFGTKAAFMSVAIWWFLFSLPLFNNVKVIPIPGQVALPSQYAAIGFKRLRETFRSIRQYPELLKYLLAFWFFNDGISTIIVMATAYGATIGIETKHLILALVITQFVGIPFTFLFGKIAVKLGSKPSLYISLSVYSVIVLLGFFMETATHFYILAAMVGMVQGGSQAIARSIYSKLTPAGRSAEFFGFLTVSSKFSSIVGPFVFGLVSQLTGNIRLGILSLLVFFIAGIGMMLFVNIEKGKLEAERKHII
jgi:UMF1 family MFS transporter